MIFKITTSIIVLLFLLTFDTCLLYFSVSQPLYKADYNIFNKNQTIYTTKLSYLFHTDFISLSNDLPIATTEYSDAKVYNAVNYYYKKNSSVQKILNYSYKFTISALVSKVIPLFLLIAYMNHVGKRYLNNDFNRIKSEQDVETPENEDDIEVLKKQLQQKQFNMYMNNFNNNNNNHNNQFQYKFNYQQQQQILINVNSINNNNKIDKINNINDNKNDNNNNYKDDSNNIKKYKVKRSNSSWIAFLLLLFNFLPFLFISIAIFYPLRLTHAIKNEEFVHSLCVNNSTNEYFGFCKTFAGFSYTDLPDNTRSEYIWRPTLSWYSLVVSIIIEAATVCITIKSLIMDSRNDSFKKVFLNFISNKKQLKQQKLDNQQQDHHNVNVQTNQINNNINNSNNNSSSNSNNNNNSIINNSGNNMTTSNNSQNSLITPESTPESTPNLTSQQTSSSVQSNIEIKS